MKEALKQAAFDLLILGWVVLGTFSFISWVDN